jgi:catechol 2,3-dioxygenase-like lactoylglutathione lyase family enzyme
MYVSSVRFRHVRLEAPAHSLSALARFYSERLGLENLGTENVSMRIGETELEFAPGVGGPFYHFALLAPGDRFDEGLAWLRERTELLPDSETGDVVFDFDNWDALACYFHDPAGNIVELIAHRGLGELGAEGPFSGSELLGLSELGLVGDTAEMAVTLGRELGLELWDGTVEEEGRLAFLGKKARTLILSPAGRGWLPTGRPAERHPCEVVLAGPPPGEALLAGSQRVLSET